MKNLKLLLLLLIPAMFVFTGCEDDEDDMDLSPSLNFIAGADYTSADVTLQPGEEFTVKLRATENSNSGTNLRNFKVERTIINTSTPVDSSIGGADFDFERTFTASAAVAEETFTFTVTDRDDQSTSVSIVVTTEGPATPLDNEILGAFFHIQGSARGAYNLVGDSTVPASANDALKDMKNTDAALSVFSGSWETGTGNGTLFVKSNSFDYANATVQSASEAFDAGTASSDVENPAENDIYVAKLRGGNDYAVIKITDIDPLNNECNCTNTGKIEFDYKKKS